MKAWAKDQGLTDEVLMLADGNAEYAKALGLELNASGFGMGIRGQRFAVLAKDGTVTGLFVEGPGEFKVSSADYLLSQL
jgi:peroxiredoxin